MAKNTQAGSVIVYGQKAVIYEGTVTEVNARGVTIQTRAYGKQATVGRTFSHKEVIAHTDVGEGFVTVLETQPVASYAGQIVADDNISVTLENGREISFNDVEGTNIQVHYDTEDGKTTSIESNVAKRNSSKLETLIAKMEERNGGAKPKKKKSKK